MKLRYIKLIVPAMMVMLLAGCESALDRYPKDKLTPESFFNTAGECELFTNDFYTMFPGASDIYGETSDIISRMSLIQEVLGTKQVTSTSSTWKWEKLRDINFFLEYSVNCDVTADRLKYQGVARFFRAYFYYEKVKRYGDVPWLDEALDSDDERLYMGRTPRKEVVKHMIEDLDFAIANLDAGRSLYTVTKWTALALKSRVCLFEGTFRKYHDLGDWEEMLEQCADASSEFMKNSGYGIYTTGTTPYLSLFSSINAIDTEIVLARAYNSSIGLTHDLNGYLTSPSMGRPGILKDIADMYLMNDGTRFTDRSGYQTMTLPQESANRDGRFAQTMRTPGYTRLESTTLTAPDLGTCETGYHPVKFLQAAKYDAYNTSVVDMPIFRAAEVYLNFAEAKAELGTLTQADIDASIKPLRDRAGVANLSMASANANPDPYLLDAVTGYQNVTGSNQGVILEIRRERTVEMMMEGLRYWDIMRWHEGQRFTRPFLGLYFPGPGEYDLNNDGTPDICIWKDSKPSTKASVVYELDKDITLSHGTYGNILLHTDFQRVFRQDRDYLYPIPTDDRILTNGAITQNPGWDDGLSF